MPKFSKVNLEVIDRWLHSITENGQSVIDFLINMREFECNLDPSDLKKIDLSVVTNMYRITEALNEYFIKKDYPFEAYCSPYSAYINIKKTKALVCSLHDNFILKTESDLNKHRECLKKRPFLSRTERKEYPEDIFVESKDRATIEEQEKRVEEERKARREY